MCVGEGHLNRSIWWFCRSPIVYPDIPQHLSILVLHLLNLPRDRRYIQTLVCELRRLNMVRKYFTADFNGTDFEALGN